MALLRNTSLAYRVGFGLFFLAFCLFLCSVAIPGVWIYDKGNSVSSDAQGLNVWNFHFSSCLTGHSYGANVWRCDTFPETYALIEKKMAVVLMLLGCMTQLAACVIIIVYNRRLLLRVITAYDSEVMAGVAAVSSLGKILLYIKFTHFAVNLSFGPGVVLHFVALCVSYAGLVLTGLYTD